MRRIKKVSENLELILETIIQKDPKFLQVIQNLLNLGDVIAAHLWSLFRKEIKTNINFLSLGPANDEISFVNDSQVKRILDVGGDPFSKSRNVQKIGRAVRQILTSNDIEVSDKLIEEFVNRYKTEWDKINTPINIDFVKGNDIKKWYLLDNYVSGSGQLNNSCMRYPTTQGFLDIYTRNPNQCQLVILKTPDNNKLLGRALLWKCSEDSTTVARNPIKVDYYLDRIYTVLDHDRDKIKEFVKDKLKAFNVICYTDVSGDFSKINRIKISLENLEFAQYPYMDSLFHVYPNEKFISYQDDGQSLVYQCRQTNGQKIIRNWVLSSHLNRYFPMSEVIMVDYLRSYMPLSECLQDYQGRWIYRQDAVQSELYGVISRRQSSQTTWGWVPNGEMVSVATSRAQVAMPRILLNTEFFECKNRQGATVYATEDVTFSDVVGQRYLSGDKRVITSSTSGWEGLIKSSRIMSEDVKPLGNIKRSTYANGVTYQLYSLPNSEIPIAIKYHYPPTQRLVGTYSFSKPSSIDPSVEVPTTSGVIALDTDINAFRLRKRRAPRGTRSTDIWVHKKVMAYDYYIDNPITDSVIAETIKLSKAGNSETSSKKLQLLTDINNYLVSQSRTYRDILKDAVIKTSTKESLYREVNKNIENFWKHRDSHVRTYMSNLLYHTDRLRGTSNGVITEQMLEDFNGRSPFETEKPLELEEFRQFLLEAREMFICQIYIWSLTRSRTLAGKTAARFYGFRDRRSAAYLSAWSYNRYSGIIGERIFSTSEQFFANHRTPSGNPLGAIKCEAAYSSDLLNIDKKTDTFEELLKAWSMFVKENFSNVFGPPLIIPPVKGERLSKVRVRKFGQRPGGDIPSPEERIFLNSRITNI